MSRKVDVTLSREQVEALLAGKPLNGSPTGGLVINIRMESK